MGFLFDVVIPALIILGVALVWFRAIFSNFLPTGRGSGQGAGRQGGPHPRSLDASGGYETPAQRSAPTRNVPAGRRWEGYEAVEQVEEPRPRRQATVAAAAAGPAANKPARGATTPQARMLARALENPEAVRTAFLVKEILDPPVGMRNVRGPHVS